MRNICVLFLLLSVAMLTSCGDSNSQEITEEEIRQINKTIGDLVDAQEIASILSYLSDDVRINVEIPTPNGIQRVPLDKATYGQMLRTVLSQVDHYEHESTILKITISEDKQQANVSSEIYESMTINGETINTLTSEDAVFQLIEGHILITSLSSFPK